MRRRRKRLRTNKIVNETHRNLSRVDSDTNNKFDDYCAVIVLRIF